MVRGSTRTPTGYRNALRAHELFILSARKVEVRKRVAQLARIDLHVGDDGSNTKFGTVLVVESEGLCEDAMGSHTTIQKTNRQPTRLFDFERSPW